MRTLIVIPCRDEQSTIYVTLRSLLAQTLPPTQILLVDDGSADNTADIVRLLAAEQPTLTYLRHAPTGERGSGSPIVAAFDLGLGSVNLRDFDLVCKFDADLAFPPDYLARVAAVFREKPGAGLVGGVCAVYARGAWVPETVANDDHIRGALKAYRRVAFEAIGGLFPSIGWDTIDEHALRLQGWTVRPLPGLVVRHFRPTNAASAPRIIGRKLGASLWVMGMDPLLALISIAKRMTRAAEPLTEARHVLSGYLVARATKGPQVSPALARHIRSYRYRAIYRRLYLGW